MNNDWIIFFLIFLVFFMLYLNNKEADKYIEAKIRRRKGDKEMQELAKRLLGKDVFINTVASGTVDGILKEVVDNSIVIEKEGNESFVNLDYVIRIREYPMNKMGKRKIIWGWDLVLSNKESKNIMI